MGWKLDPTWEDIVNDPNPDEDPVPSMRQLIRALVEKTREQDAEISRLRERLTRLWWQVNPEGDDPP